MGKAPKTPKLSIKARVNPTGYTKSSTTESTITRGLRNLRSYINFSESGPRTLTSSPPPSTPSVRASSLEIERPIPYKPFANLPNSMSAVKVGPNDKIIPIPIISPPATSPAPSTQSISSSESSTEEEDSDAFEFESSPEFKAALKPLKLGKGPFAGHYKCTHCRNNRKRLAARDLEGSEIICGCTKNKAVCEALLIQREILVSGNDQILRDLSFNEWYKLDHIMAALFGFNTSWLLDPQIMKAGLQAAADSM